MTDCLFCKIANKEIPSEIVYENDDAVAFMDINPTNKGHVLVIPKKHFENILDMPDEILEKVIVAVKKVAKAVKESLNCDGFNIGMNNFPASGQVIMHAHFHIIPRYDNDGLQMWPSKKYEEGEIKAYAEKIKNQLQEKQ